MEYRLLGKTGLKVSEIGMGTWAVGGALAIAGKALSYGEVSEEEARQAIRASYDAGITLFDTADFYGLGRSEHLLGDFFQGRSDVTIVTKAGYIPDGKSGSQIDLSYHHLMAAAERSLRRLRREVIDVFLIHSVPEEIAAWEGCGRALRELKRSGLIRHGGLSVSFHFDRALPLLKNEEIEVIEVYYNLFTRGYEKIREEVKRRDIGVIGASPLYRGFLSDGFLEARNYASSDVRQGWNRKDSEFQLLLGQRQALLSRLNEHHLPLTGFALAFVLKEETVSTVIPGFKLEAQMKENLEKLYGYNYPKKLLEMA